MTPAKIADGMGEALGARMRCQIDGATVTVEVAPGDWLAGLAYGRDRAGCDFFDWLTGVDEGGAGFTVVAHLYSIGDKCHLLLRTTVPRHAPVLASAAAVFRGAAWHEREVHDMFGIVFEGHPRLEPLLLPGGFEGHPLRKDFGLGAREEKEWPGLVEPGESRPMGGVGYRADSRSSKRGSPSLLISSQDAVQATN